MHPNHTPNPIITMKKTLFLTIFTILLIGCSATKKSTNSNSSISNTQLKEDSITTDNLEETDKDYIEAIDDRDYFDGICPQYYGGIAECMKFIKKNIQYPEEAIKEGIEGRVICQFTVKTDGSIDNIIIVRSVHKLLDQEAIRIINSMPKWIPGTNKNLEPKDWKYTLPVTFKLPK